MTLTRVRGRGGRRDGGGLPSCLCEVSARDRADRDFPVRPLLPRPLAHPAPHPPGMRRAEAEVDTEEDDEDFEGGNASSSEDIDSEGDDDASGDASGSEDAEMVAEEGGRGWGKGGMVAEEGGRGGGKGEMVAEEGGRGWGEGVASRIRQRHPPCVRSPPVACPLDISIALSP